MLLDRGSPAPHLADRLMKLSMRLTRIDGWTVDNSGCSCRNATLTATCKRGKKDMLGIRACHTPKFVSILSLKNRLPGNAEEGESQQSYCQYSTSRPSWCQIINKTKGDCVSNRYLFECRLTRNALSKEFLITATWFFFAIIWSRISGLYEAINLLLQQLFRKLIHARWEECWSNARNW